MNKSLRNAIFINTVKQLLLAAVLLAFGLSFVFHSIQTEQKWTELRRSIDILSSLIYHDDTDAMCEYAQKLPSDKKSLRITLIAQNGTAHFDNRQNVQAMENQGEQAEISQAFASGYGESKQTTASLTEETYAVATKLTNGWVLRISDEGESFIGMLLDAGSWAVLNIVLVLCISLVFSRHLAKRILSPIEKMISSESWADTYDELSPLIRRLQTQSDYIEKQNMSQENSAKAMQTLLSSMREGIALLDKDGVILFMNDSARKYLNVGMAQTDGKNIVEITRQLAIHEGVQKALHGESLEWIHTRQDSSLQLFFSPVESFAPLESNGAIILLMDVTHRIHAEKMRLEFTANVSHELKTPLTTIYGYAELLSANMVKQEDQDTFVQKIMQEASRLLLLIDDLLLLSHLHEAAKSLEMKETALFPIINHCVEDLRQRADAKGVSIATSCQKNLTLYANERMITEMLHNLIENAVKYNTVNGHISICAQLDTQADEIAIDIIDTGIGIPQEYHTRVFERFFRIDKSRSRKTGGTGLGLSIVKHIVEIHHGKITLESKEDVGTSISVTLPHRFIEQQKHTYP